MNNDWQLKLIPTNKSLNEQSHIFCAPIETILEIYNYTPIEEQTFIYEEGDTVKVINWRDMRDVDCVAHIKGEKAYWQRYADHFERLELFKKGFVVDYKFGYIAGTMNPFGPNAKGMYAGSMVDGYEMWQKYKMFKIK